MWANSLSIRTRFFFKVKTIPSMLLQLKITIQHPHTQYALLNSHSATQLAQTSCLFQIQPQNIHQVKILHALDKPTQQRFLQLSTSPWRRKSITVYGLHIETHTPSYTHSSSPPTLHMQIWSGTFLTHSSVCIKDIIVSWLFPCTISSFKASACRLQ